MNQFGHIIANLLPALILLVPGKICSQDTYHVYSAEIPWMMSEVSKEEGKVYSITEALQQGSAGDSIIVHEGIYRETVSIGKDSIVPQNYQNDYVLVSGASVVSGWTSWTFPAI